MGDATNTLIVAALRQALVSPEVRAVVVAALRDEVDAAVEARLRARGDGELVDQDSLPATVSRRQYLEACRTGKINGAVKRDRQWIARRTDVLAWWTAKDAPAPSNDAAPAADPVLVSLRAQGFDV